MSRLVQALRSLRAEPAEATEMEAGPDGVIRPRRRDPNALFQGILKRLTLTSPPGVENPRAAEQAKVGASLAGRLVEDKPGKMRDWEAEIAKELSQPAVEQEYRELANRVLADIPAGISQNVLLTCIGCAGEETLMRLAIVLASIRGPILMVDANAARTPLTINLQRTALPGLEDLLCGRAASPVCTSHDKVLLLPAGARITPGEVPSLSAVSGHLAKWRNDFPLVLMDGGDALSDRAVALSRFCDATYLLVGLGVATTESAREANQRLRSAGGRVLGCVAVEPVNPLN